MIAVDPGLRGCGVAWFGNLGELWRAAWVPNPVAAGDGADAIGSMVRAIEVTAPPIVVERMHWNMSRGFAGKALIALSLIGGGLHPTHLYTYREWAGDLTNDQIAARILSRLSDEERARIGKVGPHKDALMAIGIGLHHLGRLAPRRVYPRA